jgi:hypothetical protein
MLKWECVPKEATIVQAQVWLIILLTVGHLFTILGLHCQLSGYQIESE